MCTLCGWISPTRLSRVHFRFLDPHSCCSNNGFDTNALLCIVTRLLHGPLRESKSSKTLQFADVSIVFCCSLMKLIRRRGRKCEVLLFSNSLTFARWPIACVHVVARVWLNGCRPLGVNSVTAIPLKFPEFLGNFGIPRKSSQMPPKFRKNNDG